MKFKNIVAKIYFEKDTEGQSEKIKELDQSKDRKEYSEADLVSFGKFLLRHEREREIYDTLLHHHEGPMSVEDVHKYLSLSAEEAHQVHDADIANWLESQKVEGSYDEYVVAQFEEQLEGNRHENVHATKADVETLVKLARIALKFKNMKGVHYCLAE